MTAQTSPIAAPRLSPAALPLIMNSPLVNGWRDVSHAINASLEPSLVQLVEIRASQINGCANCINMHAKEARSTGETEQRIYLLPAWREAPCYSERERAALGWTEALMRLCEGHHVAAAHEVLKQHFTEEEQIKLTLVLVVINGWNLIAVGFGLFADQAPARAAA
jgi:AhpD family alkylhydroperoxidase